MFERACDGEYSFDLTVLAGCLSREAFEQSSNLLWLAKHDIPVVSIIQQLPMIRPVKR
jgi:hypothetical protein